MNKASADSRRWAFLDDKYRYRYILGRQVSDHDGVLLFILLNPSTADAVQDDATIRRCMGFTKSWGFGTLEVVNLFALRATDPESLKSVNDPIGSLNDENIIAACSRAHRIVAGWGVHGRLEERSKEVLKMIQPFMSKAFCFGLTKAG